MALPKVGSIGEYIREQRQQAKISLRQLAEQAGVSNPYLSQIERGLRKPSAEILNQIAKGLHISAQALYVQAGLMEDREAPNDVIAAIRADTFITGRQRQVMIDIYESFRKENHPEGEQPSERSATDDESPLPEELLSAIQAVTSKGTSGNGTVNQASREG